MSDVRCIKCRAHQVEQWECVAGHIKDLLGEYDHTKDDHNRILADINNILDSAFCYMPAAIEEIKSKGIK